MGLFDFVSNIGKKVFGIGDADAAEKIAEHIEKNNPGVTNLTVELDDNDVCTLGGDCLTVEAKEKLVLMAGNMKGVGSVMAEGVTAPEPVQVEDAQYYVIEKGDTLWGISSKLLGNGAKYKEIFEANKEVIEDPDLIFPGQKIRIPR